MKTADIINSVMSEIIEAEGVKEIVIESPVREAIEEMFDRIESWEYYSSDGDCNFYDADSELVLSLRVEEGDDGALYLTGVRDR